jgi:methionine synthase II (cobalamin-independent)
MFATLLGALPRPTLADGTRAPDDDLVRLAIERQEAAGLEPLTDGGLGGRSSDAVAMWETAANCATGAVKQRLVGPYSAGRAGDGGEREVATLAAAEALNRDIRALAAAGCPLVEIEEPLVVAMGDDGNERRLFIDAHRRLTAGIAGIHLSLALVGGNADTAGAATFFDLPYASYAVDLIAGPDNWRLVTAAPADRGIVCGALAAGEDADEGPEILVWAAHYAASSEARGLDRVGLANAPGLDRVTWQVAERKFRRLAEAARIASFESGRELAEALDPRAVSSRSAALGRAEPPLRKRRPRD